MSNEKRVCLTYGFLAMKKIIEPLHSFTKQSRDHLGGGRQKGLSSPVGLIGVKKIGKYLYKIFKRS